MRDFPWTLLSESWSELGCKHRHQANSLGHPGFFSIWVSWKKEKMVFQPQFCCQFEEYHLLNWPSSYLRIWNNNNKKTGTGWMQEMGAGRWQSFRLESGSLQWVLCLKLLCVSKPCCCEWLRMINLESNKPVHNAVTWNGLGDGFPFRFNHSVRAVLFF